MKDLREGDKTRPGDVVVWLNFPLVGPGQHLLIDVPILTGVYRKTPSMVPSSATK